MENSLSLVRKTSSSLFTASRVACCVPSEDLTGRQAGKRKEKRAGRIFNNQPGEEREHGTHFTPSQAMSAPRPKSCTRRLLGARTTLARSLVTHCAKEDLPSSPCRKSHPLPYLPPAPCSPSDSFLPHYYQLRNPEIDTKVTNRRMPGTWDPGTKRDGMNRSNISDT